MDIPYCADDRFERDERPPRVQMMRMPKARSVTIRKQFSKRSQVRFRKPSLQVIAADRVSDGRGLDTEPFTDDFLQQQVGLPIELFNRNAGVRLAQLAERFAGELIHAVAPADFRMRIQVIFAPPPNPRSQANQNRQSL